MRERPEHPKVPWGSEEHPQEETKQNKTLAANQRQLESRQECLGRGQEVGIRKKGNETGKEKPK